MHEMFGMTQYVAHALFVASLKYPENDISTLEAQYKKLKTSEYSSLHALLNEHHHEYILLPFWHQKGLFKSWSYTYYSRGIIASDTTHVCLKIAGNRPTLQVTSWQPKTGDIQTKTAAST